MRYAYSSAASAQSLLGASPRRLHWSTVGETVAHYSAYQRGNLGNGAEGLLRPESGRLLLEIWLRRRASERMRNE